MGAGVSLSHSCLHRSMWALIEGLVMDPSNLGTLYLVLFGLAVLLGIVLLICWIVLPFAVIGTKQLLRDLLREQKRTNELLARQALPPAPLTETRSLAPWR